MLLESFLLLYAIAVGFVAAGLVTSFYQLVTSEPARFQVSGYGLGALAAAGIFFAFSGPLLVFRAVVHARLRLGQPLSVTIAGLVICLIWSCSLGLVLLDSAVRLLAIA